MQKKEKIEKVSTKDLDAHQIWSAIDRLEKKINRIIDYLNAKKD